MAQSHTTDGRTEAEILQTAARAFEEADYAFPPLEVQPGVGVIKYARAAPARKFRKYNSTFQNLTIKETQAREGGRSVVTPVAVRENWTVEEVINSLIESGAVDQMIDEQAEVVGDREFAEFDVTYSLYIVAKGWVAEQQVDEYVDFLAKMGVSHDVGGIDFQNLKKSVPKVPAYSQLRSWTWARESNNASETENGIPVMYYGWHEGELILSEDGYEVRQIVTKDLPVREGQRKYEFLF